MRAVVIAGVLLLSIIGRAESVYVWTGAVDGKWLEPGNWTVKGSEPSASPTAAELARDDYTVEFTSVTGGHTTIDLANVDVISNVIIRAGAPKYTFGASADQVFSLVSHYNVDLTGGRLTIEAGAAVPDIMCRTGWRRNQSTDGWSLNLQHVTRYPTIINNASDPLVLTNALWKGSECTSSHPAQMAIGGTGTVRLAGYADGTARAVQVVLVSTTWGRVVWAMPGDPVSNLFSVPSHCNAIVEVAEGSILGVNGGYQNMIVDSNAKLRIEGKGTYLFSANPKTGTCVPSKLQCDTFEYLNGEVVYAVKRAGKRYVSSSCIPPSYDPNFTWYTGPGTVTFEGESVVSGAVKVVSGIANAKLRLPSIGLGKETASSIGYADLHVAGDGIIDYIGAGETCDRSLTITNHFANAANANWNTRTPKAQLWHDGTGPLVWNGPIELNVDAGQDATLTLGGAAASSATLGVALADAAESTLALNKIGSGLWRLSQSCTFTGATTVSDGTLALGTGVSFDSPVTMSGGTLQVEDSLTLASVAQTSGASTLRVVGESTLTITAMTLTGGTLNLIPDDTAIIRITGLAGQTPSGLLWKGLSATVGADGTVQPAGMTAMAAKGDTLSDNAGTVGILSVGSGANSKLAASAVAVGCLQQLIQTPATLAIGAGETLTAGEIKIAANSGELTVGETSGVGTVAGAGSAKALKLTTDSDSTLTVNAAIAAGTDVRIDKGAATLAGGAAATTSIHVSQGALTLAGEQTYEVGEVVIGTNVNVATTLTVRDATVHLGENSTLTLGQTYGIGQSGTMTTELSEMVVTNATIAGETLTWGDKDYRATLLVGRRKNGWLEVQGDSLISNRLNLGNVYNTDTIERWYTGTLRQRGGCVKPLGSATYGSGIGTMNANGHYRMEAGELLVAGTFPVAAYGPGSLTQLGGKIVYEGILSLSDGNGGRSLLCTTGGTIVAKECIRLSPGANGGISSLVLEGNADVTTPAVFENSVKTGYENIGTVALNGGVLTSSGFSQYNQALVADSKVAVYVGFNGGTLRLSGTYTDSFFSRTFTSGAVTHGKAIEHATIYAGGATIDTDGKAGNYTASPIEGASGKGIVAIPMTTTYVCPCPPVIEISGNGYGAIAMAEWDPDTRIFTGIRVVQPGCNYTWAKAKALSTGSLYYFANVDCTLADNANTGSFTKAGEGAYTLKAANSYGGDTVLKGGTLTAEVAGAIPSGSTVVFAGGTLTVGDGVAKPTAYAVDYAVSVQAMPSTGGYVFPEGASIKIRNVPTENLPERVDLLYLGAGYAGPKPSIDLTDVTLPKGYSIRWAGNRLRLGSASGLVLIVR